MREGCILVVLVGWVGLEKGVGWFVIFAREGGLDVVFVAAAQMEISRPLADE